LNVSAQNSESSWGTRLLALTVLNCLLQIGWFWRFQSNNITIDAINYIGLARHLVDGHFVLSLHGYWSPLFSWLIAAGSLLSRNLLLVGRIITIGSFLVCLLLLYRLVWNLWRSRVAAGFAVLWFSLCRGVVAVSVGTILADFLLVAAALVYFTLLLSCLRENRKAAWVLLGVAHAVAFLAKAFAMPWLTISTVLALLTSQRKSLRQLIARGLLAFLVPAVVWLTWGEVLKTKYGVFTTGYQLRANLMVDQHRMMNPYENRAQNFLDTSATFDAYMVGEASWQKLQKFNMSGPQLLTVVLDSERRNIPAAMKEVAILLTPGGLLGLAAGLVLLTRNRFRYSAEAAFAWIAVVSLLALIGAYCMLVFDSRYVLPITPVLIAVACNFVLPAKDSLHEGLDPGPWVHRSALGLLVVSWLFLLVYWASPFRTQSQNYQISCHEAAAVLRAQQPDGNTLVSIGEGPYPAHGIGFEAGIYAAYLSGRRILAMNAALPRAEEADRLIAAVLEKDSDAVVVWGEPPSDVYRTMVHSLQSAPGAVSHIAVHDPQRGEVGTVILFRRRA
jgi:4-amino-4-deoxy-L-arabinose transferase-like glycosyltransferase